MKITINGEEKKLADGISITNMLDIIELNVQKIAVERNREIVPKTAFSTTKLQNNDKIEIVAFIGGG